MERMYQRFLSACTGACTAMIVAGIAFAAAPTIGEDGSAPKESSFYELSYDVTDEDLAELSQYMDTDILRLVKDKLVDDRNYDIVIAYSKYDPSFESKLISYMSE